jgi:predicted CXXCH cytochrome family protein
MSPKQNRPGKSAGPAAPSTLSRAGTPSDAPTPGPARRRWLGAGLAVAALAAAAGLYFLLAPTGAPSPAPGIASIQSVAPPQPPADFVGAAACKSCHEAEFKAWEGSHHKQAMQVADEATMLGDFNNVKFKHFAVESTFFKRDGKFMVRTDGPDGKLADYEVSRTFGVWPLQQYMVAFPGGRYQMLPIAWDSRTQAEGGQRWFHLSPGEKMDHKDPLHWTGRYQNWNLQCAACHSTNLVKGYDAASDSYKTTFSEINVSCEACHGPASRHMAWAAKAKAPFEPGSDIGLVSLKSRWQDAWKFPSATAPHAQRDKPADAAVMNNCAACHARRSTLVEHGAPGGPLEDTHRAAMLTSPTFHADGQQLDEVFVWNSWLQTKMHQRGVTCMDCHDAHTAKLRVEGNAVCARCHNAAVFDTEKHSFHKPGSKGAQCVECHMPEKNYMVVDARRDHAIRVPRPDLSKTIGTPNACNQCHTDQKPDWAATAMDQWYGSNWRARPQYGTTLQAGATQGAAALPSLMALAQDAALPPIVRATALTLAQSYLDAQTLPTLRKLLDNADPMLRIAALGALDPFEPAARVQAAAPLLGDAVRGVRVEAARLLADIPDAQFPADHRDARERALKEYVDSLKVDADWPSANVNLGNLYLRQRRMDDAIAAFQRALSLDPQFTGATLNLADAYRQSGRDAQGEKLLRDGIAQTPRNADLHHALGLLLVRKGDKAAALQELALAARLAPDNARYAYVHAVAVNSAGQRAQALALLRAANSRHPNDIDVLSALISLNREAGDVKAALVYAKKAAEILPDDPGVKRLVAELGARQ